MKNIFKKEVTKQVVYELPNKEHIKEAAKYCSVRDKAIILLQF